jgi:hypothetical protein
MRCGTVVAAAFLATTVTALSTMAVSSPARAEEYCGFSARPGAIVECGYSSIEGCQNDIGKGAMCFVNPYLVMNERRATPTFRHPEAAA